MINPDVSNKDRTKFYLLVMFTDLNGLGLNCQRSQIDPVLRNSGLGILNDSRYFLKKDAPCVVPGQMLPKSLCRKVRCCSISKEAIDGDVLDRLYHGKHILVCK